MRKFMFVFALAIACQLGAEEEVVGDEAVNVEQIIPDEAVNVEEIIPDEVVKAAKTCWADHFKKLIDSEYSILKSIPVHPNSKIVLCMIFPTQHYIAYKVRLNKDRTQVKSFLQIKYVLAKKYFPWLKLHKKSYLEPLKGSRYRIQKQKVSHGSPIESSDVHQFDPDTII